MQIEDVSYPVCDAGFSGSEFGVQGMKVSYRERERERGCDELETWAKAALTFTIFHQRCVVKLAFLMEVRLLRVLSFFAKPVLALPLPYYASYYILSLSNENVSLLQGHCFDTMSFLRLTLLRLGNVGPISVCLNVRPKMAPGAAWPLCPLCICLFCLDIDCC
jgi:hypothetical protein